MIANNSSGMRSVRYKRTLDHMISATVMLASGDVIKMEPRSRKEIAQLRKQETPEGQLWDKVVPILKDSRDEVEKRFPKVLRRVGGYSLGEFPDTEDAEWNLSKLIGGSEGTLGILLEAKLALVEKPKHIGIVAVHFDEFFGSMYKTPVMLKHNPLSIELVDSEVIELARANPGTAPLSAWVEGDPKAILTVELTGETEEELKANLDAFVAEMKEQKIGYAWPVMIDEQERHTVIELRKAGLGILLSMKGDLKPIPFIEDACVPPEVLGEYLEKVWKICDDAGFRTVYFGHASVGVIHVRPIMNMKDPKHTEALEGISEKVMRLVRDYGGSWSGEHGDGIARGGQNHEFWGEKMIDSFRRVKKAFDPDNLLNPGRVFDTPPMDENLRYGEEYEVPKLNTFFRFETEHGFDRAVEMCNGVGACRKTMAGTMCPSYMATRDEEATTRGRANALRLAISGKLGPERLANEELNEVLDLCLECKACKTECPSSVDMSKMKSEQLAAYQEVHGRSLRSMIFAQFPLMGRLAAGPPAKLFNAPLEIPWLARMAQSALGIAPERELPKFAEKKLTDLVDEHRGDWQPDKNVTLRKVVLFGDCFTNYNEPSVGLWAMRLLERLGYRVELVADTCCQRTRISKGYLYEARDGGAKTVEKLYRYARQGVPILGIEPSCVSSLTDDLKDLVPNKMHATKVAEFAMPVEEFLAREVAEGRLDWPEGKPKPSYLVHGHCHQKALFSTSPTKALLSQMGNGSKPNVEEVDSGCCGMAGSFGYETEHYRVSQRIGEQRLFPAVRSQKEETGLIANGFSCRHQIREGTGRDAVHIVEALARAVLDEHEAE
jgi:Fe-S oxidoreductase/FAD/FMN-containing dehydrogenase